MSNFGYEIRKNTYDEQSPDKVEILVTLTRYTRAHTFTVYYAMGGPRSK